jgi:hypothetical protein
MKNRAERDEEKDLVSAWNGIPAVQTSVKSLGDEVKYVIALGRTLI